MAEHATKNGAMLSGRTYDFLKAIAQYYLPALGALYAALSTTWGLPFGFEVVATVTALDIFLGSILGLSKKSYNESDAAYDGAIVVDESGDTDIVEIEMNEDPVDFADGAKVSLKLKKGPVSTSR